MKIQIDVFDLAGRKVLGNEVYSVKGENQFTFSKNEMMNMSAGAYIIRATSSDNSKTSTHKKLMKQ
jgi:hypothetical protein